MDIKRILSDPKILLDALRARGKTQEVSDMVASMLRQSDMGTVLKHMHALYTDNRLAPLRALDIQHRGFETVQQRIDDQRADLDAVEDVFRQYDNSMHEEHVDAVEALILRDALRKLIIARVEFLRALRNNVSSLIPVLKKSGENTDGLMRAMKLLSDDVKILDADQRTVDALLEKILLNIPNIPDESVPVGATEADNMEIRRWGEPPQFEGEPQAHWDIGENLGILDFAAGAKITGARFTVYRGLGARLERALISFMLDTHTQKNGYTEVLPPYMVNRASMTGTGQLPKFEEDAFKVQDTDYFLVPTAEVPVTNLLRDEIIDAALLPVSYTAYSACFRAEAGAAGRDTRGLIRLHQFNKVELVKFAHPRHSYEALEQMTRDAESILQLLKLPYRVVLLCTGDMGFSAAKTYDLEVYMPSYGRYVEISSCSNCTDFQARRARIRMREGQGEKPQLLHTLNGSGLAVGRTVAAILENYQQEDGSVRVPEVLIPYMGVDVITK